jgi:outer membrane protein assembly factor BamA
VGDTLGHQSVLELGIKVTSTNLPFFKIYDLQTYNWTVRPFLFSNIAILPSEFESGNKLTSNLTENSVASAGFGLQIIHYYLSAELYYSLAVHKHKYEFGTELQFNFGID